MSVNNFSYLPGYAEGYDLPLKNFLPTLPKGSFPAWVKKRELSDQLLIDPISANPLLAVDLGASGYRVLCARSNPIIWLITEVAASAPNQDDFKNVVNMLLNSRHENTILFNHLQDLYITPCENCGKMIQPNGFVWEKGEVHPVSRVYQCPFCADEGEKEISEFDIENLNRLGNLGMHRSRAFQKVFSGGEYEQTSLNLALDCYLPRALYVCMLLVNRMESLSLKKDEARYIRAALLSVFDDAHSLKHWPSRDYRFLQVSIPTKFFERNLSLSLQDVPRYWNHIKTPVKVSYWPNLPDDNGGICFYQRDLPEKNELIPADTPAAITTIFPRPSQAFWTLSAMWSGWLWGRKAVTPLRSALGRRRYDWYWFTKAVHIALQRITSCIQENSLVFGVFPQYTPNLAYGLCAGMRAAGFTLEGSAFRVSDEAIQCQWKKFLPTNDISQSDIDIRKIIGRFLTARGEPVEYHHIIMQIIFEFAHENGLPARLSDIKESDFTRLQNRIRQILEDTSFLQPFSSDLPGGSRWWLLNEKNVEIPISEKIESFIRRMLLSGNEMYKEDIETEVYSEFSGERTPEPDIIRSILQSYTDSIPDSPNKIKLCPNETINSREKDLEEMKRLLFSIGRSFNFQVEGDSIIYWNDPGTKDASLIFYLTISAEISQFILKQKSPGNAQQVIVFPGSRSSWIYYRLQHDPRLASEVENGWHFLKFRALRRLAKKEGLDLQSWNDLLDSDPPLWNPPTQLHFL